jgi:hypothetical protein
MISGLAVLGDCGFTRTAAVVPHPSQRCLASLPLAGCQHLRLVAETDLSTGQCTRWTCQTPGTYAAACHAQAYSYQHGLANKRHELSHVMCQAGKGARQPIPGAGTGTAGGLGRCPTPAFEGSYGVARGDPIAGHERARLCMGNPLSGKPRAAAAWEGTTSTTQHDGRCAPWLPYLSTQVRRRTSTCMPALPNCGHPASWICSAEPAWQGIASTQGLLAATGADVLPRSSGGQVKLAP